MLTENGIKNWETSQNVIITEIKKVLLNTFGWCKGRKLVRPQARPHFFRLPDVYTRVFLWQM